MTTKETIAMCVCIALFGIAAIRILGLDFLLYILLSPVRRYDFDEEPISKAKGDRDGE